MRKIIEYYNLVRLKNGFLSINEMIELTENNTIFDIYSVLIGREVNIGKGNIIYPNVVIENNSGSVSIGNENKLFCGLRIAAHSGMIEIGSKNEIGENQVLIKCSTTKIEIKNECRIMNGAIILDDCYIGNGSQVLGNIKMSKCYLEDGKAYTEKNPNLRGGVIKGFGNANGITIKLGLVINGQGKIENEMVEKQEKYHPNWMNEIPK